MLRNTVIIGKGERGVGQVAGFFAGEIEIASGRPVPVAGRGEIAQAMEKRPFAVIVATPSPAVPDILYELRPLLQVRPVAVIFPQNGVKVDRVATDILGDLNRVDLVAASLYTAIARDEDGRLRYNEKKRRLDLAPVRRWHERDAAAAKQLANEFRDDLGFNVHESPNAAEMRHRKLVYNALGLVGSLIGYTIVETFADPKLWEIEMTAHQQRLQEMGDSNWSMGGLSWVKPHQRLLLTQLPRFFTPDQIHPVLRAYLGKELLRNRGVEPAQYRAMREGRLPAEYEYYFAFGDRAGCYIDQAVRATIKKHEISEGQAPSWVQMEPEARRQLIIDSVGAASRRTRGS